MQIIQSIFIVIFTLVMSFIVGILVSIIEILYIPIAIFETVFILLERWRNWTIKESSFEGLIKIIGDTIKEEKEEYKKHKNLKLKEKRDKKTKFGEFIDKK